MPSKRRKKSLSMLMGRRPRLKIHARSFMRKSKLPMPMAKLTFTRRPELPVGVIGDPGTVSQVGNGRRRRGVFRR